MRGVRRLSPRLLAASSRATASVHWRPCLRLVRQEAYLPNRHSSTSSRKAAVLDLSPLPTPPGTSGASPAATETIAYEPLPRSLAYRRGLLLLHVPVPPARWPARLELASALLAQANTVLKGSGIAFNAIWDGEGEAGPEVFDGVGTGSVGVQEAYTARLLFPDGKVFEYERFDKASLRSEAFVRDVAYVPDQRVLGAGVQGGRIVELARPTAEILVCTHGSRDCRCADRGGALVRALRDEVRKRRLGDTVRIGEIAHVGGHKYAANAITIPSLDMFGNLAAGDAGKLLDHLASTQTTLGSAGGRGASQWGAWEHWRGRYGLTEEQQIRLWDAVDPERKAPVVGEIGADSSIAKPPTEARKTGAESVLLRFKTWEGDVREVHANVGQTLLEVGKAHDLPSLEGTCGGNLECATCHLYIPSSAATATATSPDVPPPPVEEASDEEFDMLGYAVGYREGASRLGCQIKVDQRLGEWVEKGGVIGLPRF